MNFYQRIKRGVFDVIQPSAGATGRRRVVSGIFDGTIMALIVFSVLSVFICTFRIPEWLFRILIRIEFVSIIIFTVEYALRICLVQAIGAEDQVDNPEDPASWQAVLVANGIDMASLASEDTVMGLESLPVVVSQDYGATSIDPLVSEDAPARKGESYNTSVEMAPDSVTVSMPEVVTAITQAKHVKPQPKPTPH